MKCCLPTSSPRPDRRYAESRSMSLSRFIQGKSRRCFVQNVCTEHYLAIWKLSSLFCERGSEHTFALQELPQRNGDCVDILRAIRDGESKFKRLGLLHCSRYCHGCPRIWNLQQRYGSQSRAMNVKALYCPFENFVITDLLGRKLQCLDAVNVRNGDQTQNSDIFRALKFESRDARLPDLPPNCDRSRNDCTDRPNCLHPTRPLCLGHAERPPIDRKKAVFRCQQSRSPRSAQMVSRSGQTTASSLKFKMPLRRQTYLLFCGSTQTASTTDKNSEGKRG